MVSTHTPGPGDAAGHGGREETFPLMPILPQQIISGRLPCLHPVFKGTTPSHSQRPPPTRNPAGCGHGRGFGARWKEGQAGSAVNAKLARGPSLEGILSPALPRPGSSGQAGTGRLGKATLSAKGRDALPGARSILQQWVPLPLPQGCWDQVVSSSNLEFQQLLLSCLRKEHGGEKSASSQDQQGASLCPPGHVTSTHRAGRA